MPGKRARCAATSCTKFNEYHRWSKPVTEDRERLAKLER